MAYPVMLITLVLTLAALLVAVIFLFSKNRQLKQQQEDLNFLNRKYRRMSEINRKRKSLASIISHDLSTPFATIDMWVHLLDSNKIDLDDDQKKAKEIIQGASAYGQKLIHKIVELEKLIPEKMIIEDFDLSALLKSKVEEMGPSLQQGAHFVLDLQEPIYLLSDQSMIKQICSSILSAVVCNAEKNSPIKLSLSNQDGLVDFVVKSEPIDYAKNKINNLFSDYKQITSSTPFELKASPLTIALRLALELNCSLSTESNEFGESVITAQFRNS
ncbi:MAG: HAMP domain-containing histidine kinase [Bacteroidetes bacterium]|nr:HAMP domain-containing histidine kinase [Bacteroidota bacterium]